MNNYQTHIQLKPAIRRALLTFAFILIALSLAAFSPLNAPGDTLTVIQMPILNIPAIHIPGETLKVTCLAPANTSGWQLELRRGPTQIPLEVSSAQYLGSPNRWELSAPVPNLPLYELYDLRVTASGGIDDTTQNAVKVIPSRKSSYYFVHITDSHIPNRIFYPNAGFDADSLEVNDLRAVMEDINIINPEFVLFTGDLINEGELEGFAGQYWYGWMQRLLAEFQVPVYVVAGNHDIGGWNATPPPQGSARRNWWRYFGWPWLDSTDYNWGRYTQDYSFVYEDVHYIGMESYDNYDNWRAGIYGGQSFILSQIQWLNQQMQLHPNKTRVLFYHYDFSNQLNLNSLGVDMGLWGHLHRNSGSINTYPYDLATRSTCSGNRSYRVVRVNGSQLAPQNTIYAGDYGTNINLIFQPDNNATADSVRAIYTNNQPLGFEHSLLRFRMPPGHSDYQVYNGTLMQVQRGVDANICYVHVDIPANTSRYVSVVALTPSAAEPETIPPPAAIHKIYPNPFHNAFNIELDEAQRQPQTLHIYDIRGRIVDAIPVSPHSGIINWDASALSSGIYFVAGKKIVKL